MNANTQLGLILLSYYEIKKFARSYAKIIQLLFCLLLKLMFRQFANIISGGNRPLFDPFGNFRERLNSCTILENSWKRLV